MIFAIGVNPEFTFNESLSPVQKAVSELADLVAHEIEQT